MIALSKLLEGLGLHLPVDPGIARIIVDSRKIQKGDLFVALKGLKVDGHHFLSQVCSGGASAVVVEDKNTVPKDYTGSVIVVPSTRIALSSICDQFYKKPSQKLKCFAVTGTNGKTTSAYMLEHIFSSVGIPTGVMGTVDHHFEKKIWKTDLTTTGADILYQRLSEFLDLGAKAAVMEVSSHSIDQHRVDDVQFDGAIFTNFTRDHLDYHLDEKNYFEAKQKLFGSILGKLKPSIAILNSDDARVAKTQTGSNVRRVFIGETSGDWKFKILEQGFFSTEFEIASKDQIVKVKLPAPGRHNVYNAVGALALAIESGVDARVACESLATFRGVPGRLECVRHPNGAPVFVDYAHTPDALGRVLGFLKDVGSQTQSGKILVVFGCGGDRDRGKRPAMVQVALQLADQLILTSDNPRTESQDQIYSDMVQGLTQNQISKVLYLPDRRAAIFEAMDMAQPNDVILVAGKGHEDYQIIGNQKLPFSDVRVIEEFKK